MVIHLYYYEGYSIQEIANLLGVPVPTVGTRLAHSRGGIAGAVHCSDGRTPLTEDNYEVQASRTFTITPMVEGYPPQSVNIFSLDGNCASFLQDGRAYYVMDTEDVQMFADHTVYLAVYQGFVPSYKEFSVAGDGTIAMREDVVGCMFTLPLDPALADPEAVQ